MVTSVPPRCACVCGCVAAEASGPSASSEVPPRRPLLAGLGSRTTSSALDPAGGPHGAHADAPPPPSQQQQQEEHPAWATPPSAQQQQQQLGGGLGRLASEHLSAAGMQPHGSGLLRPGVLGGGGGLLGGPGGLLGGGGVSGSAAGPPPGLGYGAPAQPPNLFSAAAYAANQWVYRDPQGVVQGPFTQLDIIEWQAAGYFQPVSRRGRLMCTVTHGASTDCPSVRSLGSLGPPRAHACCPPSWWEHERRR